MSFVNYDEKNHRMLSELEYLDAKDRHSKELEKIAYKQNLRTQELIKYINDPNEIEELKVLRFYVILSHDDISCNYSKEAIRIMKEYHFISKNKIEYLVVFINK